MPESKRDRWGSHRGFLLATLGSAVGLGNVWRFSYEARENGGGAFLLVYLAMVCLVGVPLLLGEFAIGRRTQRESAAAIAMLSPVSPWRGLGGIGGPRRHLARLPAGGGVPVQPRLGGVGASCSLCRGSRPGVVLDGACDGCDGDVWQLSFADSPSSSDVPFRPRRTAYPPRA